ncbi:hypothetical protein IQ07DRAFT_528404 [Pyrenochaeta sp. DS3sAY3a]|nr:hypothetical protein IQ07DRAFT_528404 [Pyrenochaeta sp. DS3sAY3a]
MRVAKSCYFCRSVRQTSGTHICLLSTLRLRKKRCAPTSNGYPCKECVSRDTRCSLAAEDAHTRDHTLGRNHTLRPRRRDTGDSSPLDDFLDRELCNHLVDLYFEIIHDKQHILFHRPTFLSQQRIGIAPEYIVWGMAAIAARFSNHSAFLRIPRRDRSHVWLQKAIHAFNCRNDLISIAALQGIILLEWACSIEGNTAQSTLFSAQGIRMGTVMHLPDPIRKDVVDDEVRIRLYWQLWMMDAWQSACGQYQRQITDVRNMPTPLEEKAFDQLRTTSAPVLSNRNGLWSAMLPLTEIHTQIMLLNEILCARATDLSYIENRAKELSQELESWLLALPPHLQYTPENVERHNNEGLGRLFSVLHIQYHFQSQLLYFQDLQSNSKLHQKAPSVKDGVVYADRCKAHATALSEIMWSLFNTPDLDCFWSPTNGHLLVVASSIHLHSLLFDTDDDNIAKTRKLLEQNFLILLQLEKYWPGVKHSMTRLRVFHKTCLGSANPETAYEMDHWMIQFLNRYDEVVYDRYEKEQPDDMLWPSLEYLSGIEKLWTWMRDQG